MRVLQTRTFLGFGLVSAYATMVPFQSNPCFAASQSETDQLTLIFGSAHIYYCTYTDNLKSDLHDAMHTFNVKLTATLTELRTKRFTNLERQEQLSERIWHLENSVIEQRVEQKEMSETLTKARLELKELVDRWRTLTSLIDHEQQWIEKMGMVSGWVWQ